MLVTDIKIGDYCYCTQSLRHTARVCVSLKNRMITLFCRLDLPQDQPVRDRATAFATEAIRQLRRMPEFRSGKETLHFSDDMTMAEDRQSA